MTDTGINYYKLGKHQTLIALLISYKIINETVHEIKKYNKY
jgi:hypothetical protein